MVANKISVSKEYIYSFTSDFVYILNIYQLNVYKQIHYPIPSKYFNPNLLQTPPIHKNDNNICNINTNFHQCYLPILNQKTIILKTKENILQKSIFSQKIFKSIQGYTLQSHKPNIISKNVMPCQHVQFLPKKAYKKLSKRKPSITSQFQIQSFQNKPKKAKLKKMLKNYCNRNRSRANEKNFSPLPSNPQISIHAYKHQKIIHQAMLLIQQQKQQQQNTYSRIISSTWEQKTQ
eukprot:TRINITY_DN12989_c0_g1_i4.p1 TRINITY_DN12989_c0_g1~~TRINITY_DN12989_c0_g1_i4.p1  ORF type:complete len:234 (-),score=-10.68 TRINITY_DN12989_c0_g1_i4:222-923(-)